MVVLSNNISNTNNSESSPSPRNLLILEKLRKAHAQQQSESNNDQPIQIADKTSKRQAVYKRFLKNQKPCSSSSSSPGNKLELAKRSIVQEKLLTGREKLKQKNLDAEPFISNGCEHKLGLKLHNRRKLETDSPDEDDETDDLHRTPTAGVLHLKEPLMNGKNETIYYDNRGRMEPMDWSQINSKKESSDVKKNSEVQSRNEESHDKIEKITECKPDAKTEFINYVKNSVTQKTVYEVRGNLEQIQNAIDSPAFKVQRMINNNNESDVAVSQEIKQLLTSSQSELYLIDKIDSPINKLASIQNGKSNETSNKTSKLKENSKSLSLKQLQVNKLNESQSMNTLTKKDLSQTNKIKKNVTDEYDDEMFNFVKPSVKSESVSSVSTYSPVNSYEIPESSVYENKNSATSISNYYLNKMKKSYHEKNNTSLDSDDISLDRSSELEDLSVSRGSSYSKFKAFRKKLKDASTQYSPKLKQNIDVSNIDVKQKEIVKNVEKENDEFLMKETYTRYFKKSNVNEVIDENNVVEISNTEIAPETEVLLKEVSTRYFRKMEEKVANITEKECIKTVEVKQVSSNKIENILVPKSDSKTQELNVIKTNKDSKFPFQNDNVGKIPAAIKKIYRENCIMDSTQQTISSESDNIAEDAESIKSDKDYDVILHGHENVTDSCVIIQEVNSNSDTNDDNEDLEVIDTKNEMPVTDSTVCDNMAVQEDIDSDEEFDAVNIEDFAPYAQLLNKLKDVAAAQKAIATGMMDPEYLKSIDDIEINNNDNNNKSSNTLKSIESSFEISDNNFSSINASVSSNLDTDSETSSSFTGSPNQLLKRNIFEDVEIDESQLKNCHLDYYDATLKLNNLTAKAGKAEMSNRMKKMTNALKNYQKNLKSEDTRKGSEKIQQRVDVMQNECLRTYEFTKRHQILEEIKKLKLHLTCKPLIKQN